MKKPLLLAVVAAFIGLVAAGLLFSALGAADPCTRGDGRATVRPQGDAVCLRDVATVAFPAGAFAAPTEVTLSTSADQDVAKVFSETTVMFLTAGRLEHELRIATGATAPNSEYVQVTMPVPDSLLLSTLAGHGLEAFAAVEHKSGQGSPSLVFEALASRFDAETQTVSFQVPRAAFAAHQLTRGNVQAIVTLAPTLSGGDCH